MNFVVWLAFVATCNGLVEAAFLGHERQTYLAQLAISSFSNSNSGMMSSPDHNTGSDETQPMNRTVEDMNRDIDKVKDARPLPMASDDLRLVLDYFMPGRRPRLELILWTPLLILIAALIWFGLYFTLVYQNDRASRDDPLARWKDRPRVLNSSLDQDKRLKDIKPDYILQFHHPDHPDAHNEDEIKASALHRCMVQDRPKSMSRVDTCLQQAGLHPDDSTKHEIPRLKMLDARGAVIQDLCQCLSEGGCEVISFTSVDNDEIFLGFSIENPKIIKKLVAEQETRLELDPSVVQHLKIGHDPKDPLSAPPFMQYDARLATNVLGKNATDLDFFKTYHGKHDQGTILSSGHRIRLIHKYFLKFMDLDLAVEENIIKSWFPAHSVKWIADLNACWADLKLLTDLTFVQPMAHIHEYFGSRLAFNFAWHGLYCKMLSALLPVAFIFWLARINGTGVVLCNGIAIFVWAKLAANLWQREEEYWKVSWDIDDRVHDYTVRPDFKGTMETSPEDSNGKSLQYPRPLYMARQAVGWAITLIMAMIDLTCIYIWSTVFEGRMGLVSAMILAIMIQVFTLIFEMATDALTRWENHKYQTDFYNSCFGKLFCLQSINSYFAFFFIAVKQPHTDVGCPTDKTSLEGGCIDLLRSQLTTTLLIGLLMAFVTVAIDVTKVTIALWWEERQLRKEYEQSGNKEMPVRGYVEEQAKYEDFRIKGQMKSMMQLVISLGYVLIFGVVAPIVVLLCFSVFAVQLRTTAYRTTSTCRRPLPRRSAGLGATQTIVTVLMSVGAVFSGYLIVQFGTAFAKTPLITRVSGLLVWMAVIQLAWALASMCIPPKSAQAELLTLRRNRVLQKVAQKNANAENASIKEGEQAQGHVQHSEAIMARRWDKIPHLIDTVD